MKNYSESNNTWKIILGSLGLIILLVTLFYSSFLASELKVSEEKNKELYIFALKSLLKPAEDESSKTYDIELEIQQKFLLPNIIDRGIDEDLEAGNWGDTKNGDQVFLREKIDEFIKDGTEPIDYPFGGGKIYIFNSPLLKLIQYYPLVQVILVGLFISLGYYLFNTARKSEQNRVWAGMAKETAHQLGTPISAMLAWIQYLMKQTLTDRIN